MVDKLSNLPYSYQEDIKKATQILKENGAKEVFIFGSIANGKFNENSDIDIAVRGLNEKDFYRTHEDWFQAPVCKPEGFLFLRFQPFLPVQVRNIGWIP